MIFLSLLIITLLLWSFNKSKLNFISTLCQVFKKLTNQTIVNNGHIIKEQKNSTNLILIAWIFGSGILTHCFVSLLLGIYSTQKAVPLVQTFEDVLDNRELLIFDPTLMRELKIFNPDMHKHLINRLVSKENHLFNPEMMKNLIDKKVILMFNSVSVEAFYRIHKSIKEYFMTSSKKYYPVNEVIYLDGKHPFQRQIRQG